MRSQYKTRQKEDLLEFLSSIPGKHVTVADICEYFKSIGVEISTTTVYRHMESLTDEGLVNKYQFDRNSCACFEYINKEKHCHHPRCFHCKCSECGTLFHMNYEGFEDLANTVKQTHGFQIDPQRTVFYGLCKDCLNKTATE